MISVEIAEFYLALNKVSASETTIKELTYYSLNDDGEEAILNPVLKLKFMGIVDTSCKIPAVQDEHERSSLLESDTELDEI